MDLFGEETEEEKKAAEERAATVKAASKKKECKLLFHSLIGKVAKVVFFCLNEALIRNFLEFCR